MAVNLSCNSNARWTTGVDFDGGSSSCGVSVIAVYVMWLIPLILYAVATPRYIFCIQKFIQSRKQITPHNEAPHTPRIIIQHTHTFTHTPHTPFLHKPNGVRALLAIPALQVLFLLAFGAAIGLVVCLLKLSAVRGNVAGDGDTDSDGVGQRLIGRDPATSALFFLTFVFLIAGIQRTHLVFNQQALPARLHGQSKFRVWQHRVERFLQASTVIELCGLLSLIPISLVLASHGIYAQRGLFIALTSLCLMQFLVVTTLFSWYFPKIMSVLDQSIQIGSAAVSASAPHSPNVAPAGKLILPTVPPLNDSALTATTQTSIATASATPLAQNGNGTAHANSNSASTTPAVVVGIDSLAQSAAVPNVTPATEEKRVGAVPSPVPNAELSPWPKPSKPNRVTFSSSFKVQLAPLTKQNSKLSPSAQYLAFGPESKIESKNDAGQGQGQAQGSVSLQLALPVPRLVARTSHGAPTPRGHHGKDEHTPLEVLISLRARLTHMALIGRINRGAQICGYIVCLALVLTLSPDEVLPYLTPYLQFGYAIAAADLAFHWKPPS